MINKEKLTKFLLKARTKTYASDGGKVKSALPGSTQREYLEKEWLYRDIYYSGNGVFMGVEAIYFQDKPVWAMSYYGNFKKMTEEELNNILKKALLENWQEARTWKKVEWEKGGYKYICEPDFEGSINELAGVEKITKKGSEIYSFYYAGAFINKE